MPTLTNKIIKGSDLMLFKDGKSVAHATNHTLSIEPQVSEINTKDTGLWGMSEVTKITWSISAEHMYVQSEFEGLFDQAVSETPTFTAYFGLKSGYYGGGNYNPSAAYNTPATGDGNWVPDAYAYMYKGEVIINSLEVSAQAGENATFSVQMTGTGPISKAKYSA